MTMNFRVALLLPLLLLAPLARADGLDFVMDVLYKAGVIDGNVKAAKPLIACLVDGKSVQDCTVGAAGQTELAHDPQVQNVIDIYQSFQQQDWYTVLKKSGITVGCALIPGGEVKDVLCGELGKIASAVADGVGSVLGAVGGFVGSMFGGGSDPAPMPEEAYYQLNFMPWYHWSVVHQLDNDTPANNQVLNAPMAVCVNYFYHHTYDKADAQKACSDLRTRLGNSGYAIGNAFRQETESYFQLHFAPKVDEWARMSFNPNITLNSLADSAMSSCLYNERKKIPLPSPGFEQCSAMQQQMASLPSIFQAAATQLYQQCQTQANSRVVPPTNDAYTRICTPIKNRIVGQVIIAMADLKSRMNTAAAAGCPNDGQPKSIHCDSYEARAACQAAMPEHASMCNLNYTAAIAKKHEELWAAINTADAPCTAFGDDHNNYSCPHPLQVMHCSETKQAIEAAWGPTPVADIACNSLGDRNYEVLKQQAQSIVDALNASYGSSPATALRAMQATPIHAMAEARPVLAPVTRNPEIQAQAVPVESCGLDRHDPLMIHCPTGFEWDAVPDRATAVYNLINADNPGGRPRQIACPEDVDRDGAEAPCLEIGE